MTALARFCPSARAAIVLIVVTAPFLAAQVASVPASPPPDAATLARFDLNKNGRLDPEELRAMEDARKKLPALESPQVATGETVTLSPFEVVADTRGYYAENTMSGTRMNTKLEDLASAISVVTKEQMADFAMLDINDIFLYGANTEGTGTFTDLVEDTGQGSINDATAGDPANANRVRGIGRANVSNGNFETSNRVPIDPLDADGVEISRGPNASVFGLGNPSGTVNIVGASANLSRNRSQIAFRADSFEGYRSSIDLNRMLLRDRLAVRVSAARQRDGFDLKPSGVDTWRYNGMVQLRPFKRTLIKASYQYYRAEGNRPNSIPPQDAIADWRAAGSPTWDPLINSRKLNGVAVGGLTGYMHVPVANYGQLYVEPSGLVYWGQTFGVSGNSPLTAIQNTRQMVVTRALVNDAQPLIGRRTELVTDRSVYDWKELNLSAPNRFADKTETSRVTIDQVVFDTGRQSLAAQFGWFREDAERYTRYIMANGPTQGVTGQLAMDINERLLDGSANPFFLRPFIMQAEPRPTRSPLRNDTYRVQAAYKLDFTANRGWTRWLGAHSLVGYGEYKDKVQRSYNTRDEISSRNPWLFANATANKSANQTVRALFRFYVGDNQGHDVDYAPGSFAYGPYTYHWGNALTGVFNREPVELGELPLGSNGSHIIHKTEGALWQAQLFGGRIVPTFGRREDRHYTKLQNPNALADRGYNFDYSIIDGFRPGDWQFRDGSTESRGVVVKPFRGLGRKGAAPSGFMSFVMATIHSTTLRYNESNSFLPAAPAQNVYFQWLPDPAGRGKDYGVSFNLFGNKLSVRVNKYETRQLNSRSGPSGGIARTALSLDYFANASGVFFGLQEQAEDWLTAAAAAQGQTLTPEQLNAQLERLLGTTPRDRTEVQAVSQSETDDILSRGHEVELHFNPTPHWTLQASFTEQQTINTRLAPNVSAYIAARLPYWTTVKDPRIDPNLEPAQLWWNHVYGGVESPAVLYNRTIAGPLKVAQASEGLARPQIRRYRGSLTTNFRLSGITEHAILRRFNVGGALRYESKGAIGYYGLQQLPAVITDYDIRRPIWDKGHVYVDALLGYRTRLWKNKVNATFQLNVRNVQEGGRLQPIAALPTGDPYQFRIISPRQFILSATFDL